MLSSMKLSIQPLLLLSLLITTLLTLSAAYARRPAIETTRIAMEMETLLPAAETTATTTTRTAIERETTIATPAKAAATTTTTSTKKKSLLLLQNNTGSQQKIEDYEKSVKIFFPTPSDSEEESKFDVYGLKTTPLPNAIKVLFDNKSTTESTEATAVTEETTTTTSNMNTNNSTLITVEDRLGILNLKPNCPRDYVIVNQHCHRPA